MKRVLAVMVLGCVVAITGCAKAWVERLDSEQDYEQGVRFYRPSLYLLITADKDGNSHLSIVPLPNLCDEFVARSRVGLGTAQSTVKLEAGWNLVEFGNTSDSKIPETLTAIGSLATAAAGVARAGELRPGLYQLLYDKQGTVAGLRPVELQPGAVSETLACPRR